MFSHDGTLNARIVYFFLVYFSTLQDLASDFVQWRMIIIEWHVRWELHWVAKRNGISGGGNGGSWVHREGNGAWGNTGSPDGEINQCAPVDRPVPGVMGGTEVGPHDLRSPRCFRPKIHYILRTRYKTSHRIQSGLHRD